MNYIKKPYTSKPLAQPKYTTIFSDDEEEDSTSSYSSLPTIIPSLQTHGISFPPYFIDPVQTSSSYHIHQAEMALFNLKSAVLDDQTTWKKVLVHKKSGVVIHMKPDKAPMFKGEAIFQGFTPHSIFYVIGMRKLWDEHYEDGNLVENLNDTTSLTYEVCKQMSTSKSRRDLCLAEKIECTQNGTILFACTSAETLKVPRLQGRTRAQIKLMGWVLEPLSSDSIPLTKVSFVIQEPVKGWVSSLTKKSLARRPLAVLSSVHNYLKAKEDRVTEQKWCGPIRKRPSLLMISPPLPPRIQHSSSLLLQSQRSLSTHTESTKTNKKDTKKYESNNNTNTNKQPSSLDNQERQQSTPIKPSLYSPHRHLSTRNESVHLLKQLYLSPLDEWKLNSTTQNMLAYTKEHHGVVYSRLDGTLKGDWLPEQVCSLILSVHARNNWDDWWKSGTIVERFSQRDYLLHWILAAADNSTLQQDLAVFTHIDSENGGRRIFMASKSINDDKIPKQEGYQRMIMTLYGWVVTLKPSSGTTELNISFIIDTSLPWTLPSQLTCLVNLKSYLSHHGCPPYIRRVSGKIIMEHFDKAANYQVAWLVRHQPPSNQHTDWCTDIRIDPSMYRHGYTIEITPTQGTRIDRNRRTVKIFTTDTRMEGTMIHIKISHASMMRTSHSLQNIGNRMIASYNSVHEFSTISPIQHHKPPVAQLPHCVSSPPAHSTNNKEHYTSSHVPKDYILMPNTNQPPLLNLTDDLHFNGQQLMVILFGMVMSYYLGKLANTC